MASKSKRQPSSGGGGTNLDAPLDTAGTVGGPAIRRGARTLEQLEFESVEPAAPPASSIPAFFSKDVPPGLKTAATVVVFVLTAGGYGVWYLSKLDSSVDVLKTNVSEVKTRSDELLRTSIQHGEKLDALEKSVDALNTKQNLSQRKK